MEKLKTFENFVAGNSVDIPLVNFIINLLLAALLATILRWIYIKFANSLSNRESFSNNFLLLALTTTLIITVVKSSLALSLGLVGALSIVRFRAAIKEPEELSYLFLIIAIGLGLGANQTILTLISFVLIILLVVIFNIFEKKTFYRNFFNKQNLFIKINSSNKEQINVKKIIDILEKYCSYVSLSRLDENDELLEISLLVEFENFEKINQAKTALQEIDKTITFNFLDINN